MGIRKHINRYKIRQQLPRILTATSCVGVVATGVLSAKAMYDYMQNNDAPEGAIDLKRAVKVSILPTAVGLGTIASFIFCRKADKAMIAGLSAATAKALEKSNECPKKRASQHLKVPDNVAVIDEDGDLYFEPITELTIQATSDTIHDGFYKFNRNYHMRGCIGSLYEFLRLTGIKKKDIFSMDAGWSEYVGWHAEMFSHGDYINWIDFFIEDVCPGKHIIHFTIHPLPICCDAPAFVMDRCNCDYNDLNSPCGSDLLHADEISSEIRYEIRDSEVE